MPPRTSKTAPLPAFTLLALLALAGADRAQASPAPRLPPAQQHTVNLNWEASKSAVVGYNVYRASKSGGPYKKVTHTPVTASEYKDTGVKPGNTYFYVVSSIGPDKKEGPKSGEIRATVPAQ